MDDGNDSHAGPSGDVSPHVFSVATPIVVGTFTMSAVMGVRVAYQHHGVGVLSSYSGWLERGPDGEFRLHHATSDTGSTR